MQYQAPNFILTITQVFLGIILLTFAPMAKLQWTKYALASEDDAAGHYSRFIKQIIAIVVICCLEAIIFVVKTVFM